MLLGGGHWRDSDFCRQLLALWRGDEAECGLHVCVHIGQLSASWSDPRRWFRGSDGRLREPLSGRCSRCCCFGQVRFRFWPRGWAARRLCGWRSGKRDAGLWHASVVLGTALIVTLSYCAQTMTFGRAPFKYVFVYWCILAVSPIPIAKLWKLDPPSLSGKSLWLLAMVYVVGFGIGLHYLKDEMIYQGVLLRSLFGIWNVPAMGLVVFGVLLPLHRPSAGRVLAVSVVLAGGMACGVARHQGGVDYSTTYDYGQQGMREAASVIRVLTQPRDMIVSMKDIGFLAERRYLENYQALYRGGRRRSACPRIFAPAPRPWPSSPKSAARTNW